MSEKASQTKILAEGAVFIALAIILRDVLPPIFELPQGGSVTAAGMLPLLWFSLRRGLRAGLEAGTVYGLIHMALPGSFIVDPVQALLDYPIAFAALGLAGLFRKYPLFGAPVGIFGRFVAHFAAGVWFFAEYAPVGMSPILYSASYNGGYLIVELIVSEVIIAVLVNRRLLNIYT
ncbi:MAG TPA: energy-coupled thiamine transporter ThiT [Candidatus Bathyarchaeia archaeon]|nr:energy-coupled thiamine transporter ThiT [Candidatus Bathyarchaeia archaeon]